MEIHQDLRKWERIKKNLSKQASSKRAAVGWFGGKHHTPRESGSSISYADLARHLNEGGYNSGMFAGSYTPPRAFLTVGLRHYLEKDPHFKTIVEAAIKGVVAGKLTWIAAYREIGEKLAPVLKGIMYSWEDPANSEVTQRLKGYNDPLVEHNELIEAIEWRVI